MRHFPALAADWPDGPTAGNIDLLLAVLDDYGPTAVEEHPLGVRVFFADEASRDDAAVDARAHFPLVTFTALLVPDDDWAERSQAALRPVQIDGVVVAPPWTVDDVRANIASQIPPPVVVLIQPSMGFGTGHHASTRLCLRLLQRQTLAGVTVLDIGTGSGVLALTACRLGAARALGIDVDRDALDAATENVDHNSAADVVALEVRDISHGAGDLSGRFAIVFANITGAMLQRHAAAIAETLAPGGTLITSGFQSHESNDVAGAFTSRGLGVAGQAEEDTWVATAFRRDRPAT